MVEQDLNSWSARTRAFYQSARQYNEHLAAFGTDWYADFLALIERYVPTGSAVLEVGCGTGQVTRLLQGRGYAATGVDLSPLFLRTAKSSGVAGEPSWWVAGEANRLPFGSGSFKAVVSKDVLEHLVHVPEALGEMVRVLQPGGVVLIQSPALLSPLVPLRSLWRGGKAGMSPLHGCETRWLSLGTTLRYSAELLGKYVSRKPHFAYRAPTLSHHVEFTGGDYDSVYLANAIDVRRELIRLGCRSIHTPDYHGRHGWVRQLWCLCPTLWADLFTVEVVARKGA